MVYTSETGTTATYYFQRNLLGDVVGIYNTSGAKGGGYTYDAWGNCTITLNTNGIANKNPIRYRGYYYDEDTKLYYLNDRYYSSLWHRFISPDNVANLNPKTPNSINLFVYANNNPINLQYNTSVSNSYIGDRNLISVASAMRVSASNDVYKHIGLPQVPEWVDTLSTGLDHGFSMINPIRSALACLQYTDLWDLMRLDGITELPGVLSKVATGVGWGLSIAGGVIAGYEKYASGASISSSIAGGLINTGISIGGMYLSTAVASYAMGALAASSLAIPGAVIVVGGAVIAVGVGIAINHFATKLMIFGNTIEGHLNNFVDWLIFWD